MKIRSFFLEKYEPNCGKMSQLAMLKNPSTNSYIRIKIRATSKI